MTTLTHTIPNTTRLHNRPVWNFQSLCRDGKHYVCWMPTNPEHPYYKKPRVTTIRDEQTNDRRVELEFDGTREDFETQCQRWIDANVANARGE